jgi:hypothetical protein
MLKINICSLFVFLALQADLTQKASEAEAYKARTHELEQIVAKKDLAMTDQKRLLKKVKVRKNMKTTNTMRVYQLTQINIKINC